MQTNHKIFVSAENNAYCGWQCKLLYFSSLTRLNHKPTFIVHDSGQPRHQDFDDLTSAGAAVFVAPSYAQSIHDSYKPRNTAGSLIHAAEICGKDDLIVLCDPDMIFLGDPGFPSSLSTNFYSYMDYDGPEVVAAMRALNMRPEAIEQKEDLRGGVPYVIPATVGQQLGEVWLEAVDAFAPRKWIDSMYAFGLAVTMLGLTVTRTDVVDTNLSHSSPVRNKVIHYCYGDETWEKRDFATDTDAKEVWIPRVSAERGTILGEILNQIIEAREFYQKMLLV